MQFTRHREFSEIEPDAWNALASASVSDSPFARQEYLEQWWRTRGGGEWVDSHLVLISAAESGRLMGIAPLFTATHEGRPTLLLVGSIEISDYLDLIVRRDDERRFVAGLLDYLARTPELASLPLDLYNIADSSPTLVILREAAAERGWRYDEEAFRPAPQISFTGDFQAYLAQLDKKQRHEIRRKMRRAGEEPYAAKLELLRDPAELEGAIDSFLELMVHDEEKARFLTPGMREHMRSLMRLAWHAGYLWLAFLRVQGNRAAGAFNFDYRNRLWAYNSAVNRRFLSLSPGWVLLAHQIKWACEHGRAEYDFMRGGEGYKYLFGAKPRDVMHIRLSTT